jgi:hypothetical protein
MQIDHVIIASKDLDATAQNLRNKFGLVALPGGTHPTGTANRVVPLEAPQYIELLGIGQEELLRSHQFGERLLHALQQGDSLFGWAVCPDDILAESARLGRPLVPGRLESEDGEVGHWHNIFPDIEDFERLPFFIKYSNVDSDRRQAGYAEANSPAQPGAISWLEVGDDREELTSWLGPNSLPLRFNTDPPGFYALAINSPSGEIVIRNEDL